MRWICNSFRWKPCDWRIKPRRSEPGWETRTTAANGVRNNNKTMHAVAATANCSPRGCVWVSEWVSAVEAMWWCVHATRIRFDGTLAGTAKHQHEQCGASYARPDARLYAYADVRYSCVCGVTSEEVRLVQQSVWAIHDTSFIGWTAIAMHAAGGKHESKRVNTKQNARIVVACAYALARVCTFNECKRITWHITFSTANSLGVFA